MLTMWFPIAAAVGGIAILLCAYVSFHRNGAPNLAWIYLFGAAANAFAAVVMICTLPSQS